MSDDAREVRIGILTCSDSRASGDAEDTAGLALADACRERGWSVVTYCVVPDDHEAIATALIEMSDLEDAHVILTCGGTGLGPRDVTPEATRDICERMAPGVAQAIRAGSMEITARAMLSRGVAGQRGSTLVINLPGSEKAAVESFGFVADQFEHAIDMMEGGGH
jgi:molybdenum cofactor synthesis domain-containing protein